MFAKSTTMDDHLRTLFDTARRMTEKDGYHITIVFLFRDAKLVQMMPLGPESQMEKYLIMREVANEATRFGADAAILIGETWGAPADPTRPYMRASESEQREEHLTATMVGKTMEPVMLRARFIRTGETVALEGTEEEGGGAHFTFAPLYEAWFMRHR
jgi:hypothetical protein